MRWICVLALVGCAAPSKQVKTSSSAPQMVIAESATDLDPNALVAWTTYAGAMVVVRSAIEKKGGPPDLFAEEHVGRKMLVDVWRERRGDAKDEYLDKMLAVDDAGFTSEYVVSLLIRPGWRVGAKAASGLKLEKFLEWARTNLAEHKSTTLARLESKPDPADQPPPGHGLDEGIAIKSIHDCKTAIDGLKKRVDAWEGALPSLGGLVPVTVEEGRSPAHALVVPSLRARAAAKGFVFVSPAVKRVLGAYAFCAIETHDAAGAERALRMHVAIDPTDDHPAGELAWVLTMQKRWDEALAQADVAIGLAADPCRKAVNWRRRGFVLIEQRQLAEARQAYLKSLELDPGNATALNELRVIDRASGSGVAGSVEKGSGLPPSLMVRSSCRD